MNMMKDRIGEYSSKSVFCDQLLWYLNKAHCVEGKNQMYYNRIPKITYFFGGLAR